MNLEFVPGTYLAFKLSDKCRVDLIQKFKPSFSKVVCHHVTIEFNLTKEKLDAFNEKMTKSSKADFGNIVNAIGIARGDGIEAIAISINNKRDRADGSFYHVTLSLEPPHKPVESNTLRDKIELIRGLVFLEGDFVLLKK
jgi:uncharacterized membrane protein